MPDTITLFHNPRCSKSRQTLELLKTHGVTPEVVLYLDTPPDRKTLTTLLRQGGWQARDLLRKGEDEYKTLGLADKNLSDDALIAAMLTHPRLIERPIVVKGDRACLGRPPENIHALFDAD